MSIFSERIFFSDGFKFFITVLEDLVAQRNNSSEVYQSFNKNIEPTN